MIVRLLASLLVTAFGAMPLLAQDAGNPVSPDASGIVAPPADFPWETITADWAERRYKVEAIRFKARDETGIDWFGSDEVMVETIDAKGSTVSDEIDDIDSGTTHDFDPALSCIIGVRPGEVVLGKSSRCDEAGEPGPFSFIVQFWEKDSFGLDFGFCAIVGGSSGHFPAHCADDGLGDDFIGRRELFFPVPDLEGTLPNIGDSFTETVVLSPCPEGTTVCGGWDLPDYSFTYRTTRLPDVRTDFRSQLQAAMARSGIPLAGDTIAAALRSVKAPVDRKAEPELAEP